MKGDFTRNTFNQFRHFSRVLMQQGRVQLDADWNEQAAILLHYFQALAADLIGPFGGPKDNCGFELKANQSSDFMIGKGRYYVDGLLCENDQDGVTYLKQSDYPFDNEPPLADGTYLAYLDVWERHITALEESAIREVALGGPDTATRAKVVWQLKVSDKMPNGDKIPDTIRPADLEQDWPKWVKVWNELAACQLKVRLKPEQASTDPCTIAPDSRYRGRENQLYRVEIHTGGTLKDKDGPTFKWSRDNGSIAAAWLGNSEDGGMIVSCARGFAAGQWIEITSDADDLLALTGQLLRIVRVEGDVLYPESPQEWDKNLAKKVRRWDQLETEGILLKDGAVPIQEGAAKNPVWIDLEDGIQVHFQSGGAYRTGDYWLIPARTVGMIEWPGDPKDPDAVTPHGIEHHFAPVWIVSVAASGKVTVDSQKDLRRKFSAIQ